MNKPNSHDTLKLSNFESTRILVLKKVREKENTHIERAKGKLRDNVYHRRLLSHKAVLVTRPVHRGSDCGNV